MKKQGVEGSRGRVIMKRRGFKGLIGKVKRSTPNPLNPRTLLLHSKGFTLIELIIIIILAGILVAVVAVKVSLSPSQIENVTAIDQAVADIQYVQMRAFASRTTSSIAFSSGSSTYTISGATNETKTLPGGTTAGTTVTFTFNSLGELTGGANQTLSIGGRTITVYRITGKVVVS